MKNGGLLSDSAQQFHRKNAEVPDIYFTLLDAAGTSPTLVLHQNAKAKGRGSLVLSRFERQKLQRLYAGGGAAYGTQRNLVKTSNLPVSQVR